MSEIYNNEVKRVVTEKVRECIGIECDNCGKVIYGDTLGYSYYDRIYYEVTTSHNDWGNDSCESIQHFDICPDCITDFVDRYFKKAKKDDISTARIEIEKTYADRHDVRV